MAGRQKPRLMVHKAVLINDTLPATCFDINEEGMYIQTEKTFKAGDLIALDFKVGDRLIKIKASVRHVQPGFGFGAKFTNIPLDLKSLLRQQMSSLSGASSDRRTILLIDSKPESRTMYKLRLAQEGFGVVEASTGSDAFNILQDLRPDLVVVDNMIDGINAYKLLQFMQTREELKAVPAVMLTTQVVPNDAEGILSLGVKAYMSKATTTPKTLADRVKELLSA